MGQGIVYCTLCGIRIPASDFEKGRAATVLARHYCPVCADAVIGKTASPGGPGRGPAMLPRRPHARRTPGARISRGLPRLRLPYMVAGAVGVLTLVLLAYALWGGGGPGHG
jgi:hypothetical protein